VGEIADKMYVKVLPHTKVFELVKILHSQGATSAVVVKDMEDDFLNNLLGVINKDGIVDNMVAYLELFSE
jgi:hypothetical protein